MTAAALPRIGSLCSGYEGLGIAVQAVTGGSLAWVADNDADASALLAYRFPDVPNLGDVKAVDWASVGAVSILVGGFPCQPFSQAGRRRGAADKRHLWPHIAVAIGALRPSLVVLENVRGHLTLGFDVVLADLAGLGYDAEWAVVTASSVGACHRRERLFIIAFPAGQRPGGSVPAAVLQDGTWVEPFVPLFGPQLPVKALPPSGSMASGVICAVTGSSAADPAWLLPTPVAQDSGNSPEVHLRKKPGRTRVTSLAIVAENALFSSGGRLLPTPTSTLNAPAAWKDGVDWWLQSRATRNLEGVVTGNTPLFKTPTAQLAVNGGSQHPDKRRAGGHGPTLADQVEHELPAKMLLPTPAVADAAAEHAGKGRFLFDLAPSLSTWGRYEIAVRLWEDLSRRPAPSATVPGKTGERLNPELSEWMMGLPAGWVTGVPGLSRNAMLKLTGNGVVPRQGEAAVRLLLSRVPVSPLD